ncbi:MAG: TlpA family protein disulfide reductase [Longimicrobiales bacterium]
MRSIALGLVMAGALTCGAQVRAQDVGLDLNTVPAPVTIEDLDGKPIDLAQFMGKKPVLLEFWATWCSLCKELEPALLQAHKKYGTAVEFLIIAVGVNQTTRSVKRHMDDKIMPGRMLWDGQGKAVRAFMAPGTSYIVVLDAKGRVVYTGSGGDQKLEPVLAKVTGT